MSRSSRSSTTKSRCHHRHRCRRHRRRTRSSSSASNCRRHSNTRWPYDVPPGRWEAKPQTLIAAMFTGVACKVIQLVSSNNSNSNSSSNWTISRCRGVDSSIICSKVIAGRKWACTKDGVRTHFLRLLLRESTE